MPVVTTSLAGSGPSSNEKSGSEGDFSTSISSAGSSGIVVTAAFDEDDIEVSGFEEDGGDPSASLMTFFHEVIQFAIGLYALLAGYLPLTWDQFPG